MITITTSGSSIVFEFDDNQHYLQNGTIEVPVNSLMLVTDDSGMFTFKKSSTNDIFLSGLYTEIGMTKDELIAFYKENMVGEQGGGSSSGITSGEVQTMIDESISGKADSSAVTEDIAAAVSGKVDTSAITSSVTSASTDSQVPSAKAVYDALGESGKPIEAGRGISITTGATADTVSFSLPISAGTGEGSIIGGFSGNTASGKYSIALGGRYESSFDRQYCKASGKGAISFGGTASGQGAFSCGENPEALGSASVAFGDATKAIGVESFVIGRNTTANTFVSFAQGKYTKTTNEAEVALGEYNNSVSGSSTWGDSGNTLFSVGNGTANNARHNAFEIRQNGDIYLTKDGQDVKLQDQLGGGITSGEVQSMIDESTSGITTDVNTISGKVNTNEEVTARALNTLNGELIGKADTSAVTESINAAVSGKVDTSAITSSVTSASTDSELPTAKAVYDALGGGGNANIIEVTQAEYDALVSGQTVDPTAMYVITDATEVNMSGYVQTSAITSAITSGSTDAQVPSAKAVNDKLGGLSIVKLTESEYAALVTKDSNTLYVVVPNP